MDYYKLALATGLTPEQAKFFADAMKRTDKPDINHLTIK